MGGLSLYRYPLTPLSTAQPRAPHPRLDESTLRSEHLTSWIACTVVTVLAFIARFWRIGHPDQVVFDEVHFGAFAGQYIRREYYFDVHPPFAKMLNGLAGWWVGFDGDFGFENIGDNYTVANVSASGKCQVGREGGLRDIGGGG